ncbi:TetR/AcrR family transcriptional regulator [Promicromonospora soli]|uniref:TetR family transcriptional regulator n=1 Tax=Promicromonospora soli TaxID=2035533 RepID=A0A919FK41_9MICO|nr:TetR/AcrR family transcriptional regulator [Promicromonospora soli]GHH67416.1 TetR family transcriptional regulator [Promicromonospora soli]
MSTTTARDRLVGAAQDLFAAQGVGATSPRAVLAASGVGQGSLYHHFPTKHDLAVAAIGATVDDALARAMRTLRSDSPAITRLVAYLERPRDALAGCKVGRLTSDQAVMDDDGLHDVLTAYFVRLLGVTTDVFRETGLPDDVARDRAHAAIAIIQGGYVLARATQDPDALAAAVRGFVGLLAPKENT